MKPEFVFYHIPKCGGTSIRVYLYNLLRNIYNVEEIYLPQNIVGKCEYAGINLVSQSDYVSALSILGERMDQMKVILCHIKNNNVLDITNKCKTITVLRHPVDRLISHYYYFDIEKFNNIPLRKLPGDTILKYCDSYSSVMCDYILPGGSINDVIKFYKTIDYKLILEHIDTQLPDITKDITNDLKINIPVDKIKPIDKLNKQTRKGTNRLERRLISNLLQGSMDMKLYNYAIEL